MSSRFGEAYVDVRYFDAPDWNSHRSLAVAIVQADKSYLLKEAAARLALRRFEIVVPSLHDIFVETVTGSGEEAA